MSDSVMIHMKPALADKLDRIRRRYNFTREEMIRLMIHNYPATVDAKDQRQPDPIERHAVDQIGLTLEEAQRQLERARATVEEWQQTIRARAQMQQDGAPKAGE